MPECGCLKSCLAMKLTYPFVPPTVTMGVLSLKRTRSPNIRPQPGLTCSFLSSCILCVFISSFRLKIWFSALSLSNAIWSWRCFSSDLETSSSFWRASISLVLCCNCNSFSDSWCSEIDVFKKPPRLAEAFHTHWVFLFVKTPTQGGRGQKTRWL